MLSFNAGVGVGGYGVYTLLKKNTGEKVEADECDCVQMGSVPA